MYKVQDYFFPLPPSALLQCCWCTCEIIIIGEVLCHINRSHMWILIRQGLTIRFNVQFVSLCIFLNSGARSFSYVNGHHYLFCNSSILVTATLQTWSAHNLFSHLLHSACRASPSYLWDNSSWRAMWNLGTLWPCEVSDVWKDVRPTAGIPCAVSNVICSLYLGKYRECHLETVSTWCHVWCCGDLLSRERAPVYEHLWSTIGIAFVCIESCPISIVPSPPSVYVRYFFTFGAIWSSADLYIAESMTTDPIGFYHLCI